MYSTPISVLGYAITQIDVFGPCFRRRRRACFEVVASPSCSFIQLRSSFTPACSSSYGSQM